MRRKAWRALAYGLACGGLGVYAWLAVQTYRSGQAPETFRAWDGPLAWIVGPGPKALQRAAEERLETGVLRLNDTSLEPVERLRAYRAELTAAEGLLVRSLRAQPAQSLALAQLAAVRWELSPPKTAEERRRLLELISLASESAPTVPDVQRRLGELLFRMGRPAEGLAYLALALELAPTSSGAIVDFLRANLFTAAEIAEAFPGEPWVLVALEPAFREDDLAGEYLDIVEEALGARDVPFPPVLLERYANACLRTGRAERLRETLEGLGPREDPGVEAERLRQRSRAHLAAGNSQQALEDAQRARDTLPESAPYVEHVGDVALALEDPEMAVEVFRDALALVARTHQLPAVRARLYRKIGQAEEARGDAGRAYDAYKLALGVDPEESHARRRIAEMQAAIGRSPRP